MIAVRDSLTEREQEILNLIAEGLSNREIAANLFISLETVKWHNKRIFEKLNVTGRDDAVLQARAEGLLKDLRPQARHNLPVQTTPFVGRETELTTLVRLMMEPVVRLVTILGPGGMGKTRLAQEVAERLLTTFTDGVFFISLAALSSPELIVSAVAETIHFPLAETGDPAQQLLNHLREKHLLLVMDNYEHLLDGATLVSDILSHAPAIKIMTTSRERLNLVEETLFRIEGLTVPGKDTDENLLEFDAVKLFLQSATRIRPGFTLQTKDAQIVTHICRQVHGMPLAILLAAAWISTLSLEEIATEIDHCLDFLAIEMRNLPERFHSIRAVFNSSWKMLSDEEKSVFMKLAVFRGSFDRQAAAQVAGASLYALTALDNKSLLHRNPFTGRYEIHELLRHYAAEKLDESGESKTIRDAHSTYYLNFMQQQEAHLKGHRQLASLNEIEHEFDNVFAAWLWAAQQRHFKAVEAAMNGIDIFCNRNHYQERAEMYRIAKELLAPHPGEEPHPVWGRLLGRWGVNLYFSGLITTVEDASTAIEQSLEIGRRQHDKVQIAEALWNLGDLYTGEGDFETAARILEESLTYFYELEDEYAIAWVIHSTGWCYAHLGQTERCIEYTAKSLDMARRNGDKVGQIYALNNLGMIAVLMGDYDAAENHFQEAMTLQLELDVRTGISWNSAALGLIAALQGNLEKASALARDGFSISRGVDYYGMGAGYAMTVMGMVQNIQGQYEEARQQDSARPYISFNPEIEFMLDFDMALAACGLNDMETARKYLQPMLAYAIKRNSSYGAMTICLPIAALLCASEGKTERAAELLSLAYAHPASEKGWMEKCQLLIPLKQDLEKHPAWGKTPDLETVIADLYSEFRA